MFMGRSYQPDFEYMANLMLHFFMPSNTPQSSPSSIFKQALLAIIFCLAAITLLPSNSWADATQELPTSANTTYLSNSQDHIDLFQQMLFLPTAGDVDDAMILFSRLSELPAQTREVQLIPNALQPNNKNKPMWFRFTLMNSSQDMLRFTLDLGSQFINKADLFFYEQQQLQHHIGGLDRTTSRATKQSKNINFNIQLKPGQKIDYLLRLESHFINRLTPALLTAEGVYQLNHLESITSHNLIGIIVGGILYLLLISLVIKERMESVYFISFLITSCILISLYHTDSHKYFTAYPTLFEHAITFIMSLNAVLFVTFYQRFFSIKNLCVLGYRISQGFSIIYIGQFFIAIAIGFDYFYSSFAITSSLLILFLLRFSWVNWTKEIPHTLLFSGCLLTQALLTSACLFSSLGYFEHYLFFSFGFAITNALLVLVFAINLATRIIDVRDKQLQSASAAATAIAASEAKGDFLAKMSHEIRTPMNGVLGMIQLLKETQLNTQQHDYIQVIEQSGSTLMTVINDILDYSKIEAGKLQLESSQIELAELTEEIKQTFAEQAKRQNITLVNFIHSDTPNVIIGDRTRLTQILINLLSNAFKFTNAGSIKIEIQTLYQHPDGSYQLRFSVTDTGIGIEPERLDKLFHAFEQADTSTTRVYGGTGLGLTICDQLIELMHGKIGINSKVGAGTTIWFDLPLHTPNTQQVSAKESASALTRGPKSDKSTLSNPLANANHSPAISSSATEDAISYERILVAEDNEVNQKVMAGMLKQLGYSVDFVANGQQALDRVKEHHKIYSLILMDCEMPVLDGYAASDKIRRWETQHHLPAVPIIAVTAHALDEMRDKSLKHGMNDHLSKPIKLMALSERVNFWLNQQKQL